MQRLSEPALKRIMKARALSGALKRFSPRMNAGAPTENHKAPAGG